MTRLKSNLCTITIRPKDYINNFNKFAVRFAQNDNFYTSLSVRPKEAILKTDRKFSGSRRAYIHRRRCLLSDNELEFVTGINDYDKAIKVLRDKFDIPLMFLTLGKDGSRAYYKDIAAEKPAFSDIKPIEKTGAGDTFEGCALSFVLDHGLDGMNEKTLTELLLFANAGASLITARKGALKVMPSKEEIERLIN